MVPSAVSLRSTKLSLACSLNSSTLHCKGTTVFQELTGHDGGPLAVTGDKPSEEQIQAWSKLRDAFATQGLAMPTAAEIARYSTFVLNKERTAPTHSAEVVPFARKSIEPR